MDAAHPTAEAASIDKRDFEADPSAFARADVPCLSPIDWARLLADAAESTVGFSAGLALAMRASVVRTFDGGLAALE